MILNKELRKNLKIYDEASSIFEYEIASDKECRAKIWNENK